MTRDEILHRLHDDDPTALDALWAEADRVRRETVGDDVHLRGLIEFSNRCDRACHYCGMRVQNRELERYRMTRDEILDRAAEAARRGYGTVVLQAGETRDMDPAWLADIVATIKRTHGVAVTLSVGEWPREAYVAWREAGADRYLLRFETSDADLLDRIHPPRPGESLVAPRLDRLAMLRELGFEVGGGVMVGLPGQTVASLADDLVLFREIELDMVGVGCYVPHPGTPLAEAHAHVPTDPDQAPATPEMTLKVLALARLLRPWAHLPASTALATVAEEGYAAGLRRGANVIMPNLTPERYRRLYDIYPTKLRARSGDPAQAILETIARCGRTLGRGPGGRIPRSERTPGS